MRTENLELAIKIFRTQFVKIVNGNVASVSTREYNTFFIKEDGSLWGMGSNSDGQLGTGSFGGSSRAFPMKNCGSWSHRHCEW